MSRFPFLVMLVTSGSREKNTERDGSIAHTIHASIEASSQDVFSNRGKTVASNVRGHQCLVCDLFVLRRDSGRGNHLCMMSTDAFQYVLSVSHQNTHNTKTKILKAKRVFKISKPRFLKNRGANLIFIEGGMDEGV